VPSLSTFCASCFHLLLLFHYINEFQDKTEISYCLKRDLLSVDACRLKKKLLMLRSSQLTVPAEKSQQSWAASVCRTHNVAYLWRC